MIRHGRALLRALLFLGLSLSLYPVFLTGHAVLWRHPQARERWRRAILKAWGRGGVWSAGTRVQVEGPPPAPPFLLVSNHLSYLDILVLSGITGAVFVAKREVRDWPLLGRMAASSGTMFIDRTRRADTLAVGRNLAAALDSGRSVIVFPEGTSGSGDEVLPFRSSLLEPAAASGHPVHAACLSYRIPGGEADPRTEVCWWGDMAFGSHFWNLLGLRRIEATVRFDPHPETDADRKALTARLEARVHRLARDATST